MNVKRSNATIMGRRERHLHIVWWTLLVNCFEVSRSSSSFASNRKNSLSLSSSSSPVANWDPSFAASSSQGTTVAVSFQQCHESSDSLHQDSSSLASNIDDNDFVGCIVLVRSSRNAARISPIYSPDTAGSLLTQSNSSSLSSFDSHLDSRNRNQTVSRRTVFHLPILSDGNEWNGGTLIGVGTSMAGSTRMDRVSRRWALLGQTNFISLTGLASDVEHVVSSIQYYWDQHGRIYEGSHYQLSSWHVVQHLSQLLYDNAQGQNSRPYGIQCLVVGLQQSGHDKPPLSKLQLYTLDPSGGYRHWGMATAIGRSADSVRKHLYQQLVSQQEQRRQEHESKTTFDRVSAREALVVAMNATMLTKPPDEAQAQYTAIILWKQGGSNQQLCAGTIDPELVEDVRRQCGSTGREEKSPATPSMS